MYYNSPVVIGAESTLEFYAVQVADGTVGDLAVGVLAEAEALLLAGLFVVLGLELHDGPHYVQDLEDLLFGGVVVDVADVHLLVQTLVFLHPGIIINYYMYSGLILAMLTMVWGVRMKEGNAEGGIQAKIHHYVVGPPAMVNFYMEEPQNEAQWQQRVEEEQMSQRKRVRDLSLQEEVEKQYLQNIMQQQNEQIKQIQDLSVSTANMANSYL